MPTNPDNLDVVQLEKQESTALGGDDADALPFAVPLNPIEDAIEVAGIAVVEPGKRNRELFMWRDGNDWRFRDVSNPGTAGEGHTLTEMLAEGAGGITEAQHKALRQLIHFISEGPAEGFASGAYKEILPAGAVFPTSVIWWESSSKLQKIVEKTIERSVGPATNIKPTPVEWKMYDTDGSTLLVTVSDAITYSGVFENTRTRTIS